MGCDLRLEPAGEPLLIHGDPSRFNQVINNLVVNALDTCEERKDSSKQVQFRYDKKSDKVVLTFKDNGAGIPPEILPKIFELCSLPKK
jgi:C4-dicarboxylate-specific signal transduction histidine kinase